MRFMKKLYFRGETETMEEEMRCVCSYHTGNVGESEQAGLALSEDSR